MATMISNSYCFNSRSLLKAPLAVSVLLSGVSFAAGISAPAKPVLPDGPGKDTVEGSCIKCHAPNVIASKRKTKDDWVTTVNRMRGLGAEVLDDDVDPIATYLATHFGPWINVNKASAQQLTDSLLVSPEEAATIVKYRGDHGDFKTLDDLLKVPNVDTGKIHTQSDNIAFKDMPAPDAAIPAAR